MTARASRARRGGWGLGVAVLAMSFVVAWPGERAQAQLRDGKEEKAPPPLPAPSQPAAPAPSFGGQFGGQPTLPPGFQGGFSGSTTFSGPAAPQAIFPPGGGPPPPPAFPKGFVGGMSGSVVFTPSALPAPTRFQFKIDPKTPVQDLLPVPPKAAHKGGPLLSDDLAQVPEVAFEERPAKGLPSDKALHHIAHAVAKVNHVNQKKHDAFMEALLGSRTDLSGLPFVMGDACRMTGARSRQFNQALQTVRRFLQQDRQILQEFETVGGKDGKLRRVTVHRMVNGSPTSAASFWQNYQQACLQEDQANAQKDRAHCEDVTHARIAALMQVLAPESAAMREGLVKYLATVSHPEATRALAKLAIFSPERKVREPAVDALKVRRERDYTDILLQGLRYPLPAVARRAGDALVQLERKDLVAQLVNLLDEPDPRAPVLKEVSNKKVAVVRELVKINHHRNCLLCHSPGNTPDVSPDVITAAVPTPGDPLPTPSQGYQQSSPDVVVRIDVTYLRQDFSVRQAVKDAHPWPEMQRFDFLVRTRVVTDKEAEVYRTTLHRREAGFVTPYQRALLNALRELTGRDTEPTAQAWRRLLGLPVPPAQVEGRRI